MSYNKDTDYSTLINEAASKGDYKSAAEYEQSRNEKIDSENLNYQKTNNYSGWLDNTDYGSVIKDKIKNGASKQSVADTLKKRVQKASNTVGLEKYAYDNIYDNAVKYIMNGNSFEYGGGKKPTYHDTYSAEIKSLISDLKNTDNFSYDPTKDELYGYYKSEYQKAGKRAMEDLLGSLAANTGGVASSYAASAASKGYDYYNLQLVEKIPELYKLAYGEYMDQRNLEANNLSILGSLSDQSYSRYRDIIGDYENDRNFAYDSYLSSLNNDYKIRQLERDIYENDRDYDRSIYEDNRDYDRDVFESDRRYDMDKLGNDRGYEIDLRALQLQEESNAAKNRQTEIDNAMKKWDALGYLDAKSAEILGLPQGTKSSDYSYKQAQIHKLMK